jgi:alpha-D-xyloside xylohydrolase
MSTSPNIFKPLPLDTVGDSVIYLTLQLDDAPNACHTARRLPWRVRAEHSANQPQEEAEHMKRRELLKSAVVVAGSAPALMLPESAAAQVVENPQIEQHEFVRTMASFDKTANGVVFHCTGSRGTSVDVILTVCTPEILRVQMCPDPALKNVKGLLEIKEDWPPSAFTVTENPEAVSVDTGVVRFEARRNRWKYAIYDKKGEVVIQEHIRDADVIGAYRAFPLGFTKKEGKSYRTNETFHLPSDENIYGFGETFTEFNKRGLTVDGWYSDAWGSGTREVYKTIPFYVTTKGYGVFINTTFRNKCDMGSRSLMSCTLTIDDPRLDLFIIYGPSLKDVLARYDQITGFPGFPPKESFGIWNLPRYRPQNSVDAAVAYGKKFRDLDIPVDFFMSASLGRGGQTEKEQLDAISKLSAGLATIGIKLGLYLAPMLNVGSEMEKEARALGYVLTEKDGSPYEQYRGNKAGAEDFEKTGEESTLATIIRDDAWRAAINHKYWNPRCFPDFTNPAAAKWWKDKIAARIKAGCYGIIMSDFAEDNPVEAYYYNKRDGREMHNVYSLIYNKANYEAVAESSGHRGIVNCRSGTAGMQRFPICWAGDPNCEWLDMANTMRAALSIGLSGVAFWSNDNAGYREISGPLTPELWMRWSQWSMFQSHTRLQGAGGPDRVPWSFGDRAIANFRKYAKLRYRLLPYIYSHAYNASKTGLPMMRAMVLEFQDDPRTHYLRDQYMFGDSLLVAPVQGPINRRTVYLPEGTWYDYETGESHTGPTTLHIEPPLEVLPLYLRGNTIIPMGPDMAYVGEKPFDPITLDIRVSSEAVFTLYDDDERAKWQEIVACKAVKKGPQTVLDLGTSKKTFIAKFNGTSRPRRVTLNGKEMPRLGSQAELEKAELGCYFDPSSTVYAKFNAGGRATTLTLG